MLLSPPPLLPPAEPSSLLLPLSEVPLPGTGDGPEPSVMLAPDTCCSLPPAAGDAGGTSGDAGGAGDAPVLPDAPLLLLLGWTVPVVFCAPLASTLLVSVEDGAAAGEAGGGEAAAAAAGAGAPAAPGQGLPRPVLPGL